MGGIRWRVAIDRIYTAKYRKKTAVNELNEKHWAEFHTF